MKRLLIIFFLILFFNCERKVHGVFFISNASHSHLNIPLRLIVDEDTLFNQNAKYTNIAPDTQYIKHIKLEKGEHKVVFETGNSKVKRVENIDFNKNKWIFLNYLFESPSDSLTIARVKKDFNVENIADIENITDSVTRLLADTFLNRHLNGIKPTLNIHIIETRPELR